MRRLIFNGLRSAAIRDEMAKTRTWRGAAVAGAAVTALAVVGCSSGSSSSSSAAGASSSAAAVSGSAAPSAGGSAASGAAVKVGLLDPTTGLQPNLSVKPAVTAAVDYINSQLGGIGGQPVSIVDCPTDGTPEKVITCANELVQDKVAAVFDGWEISSGSALPILTAAGIPLVGPTSDNSVTNAATKDTYYLGPDEAEFAIAPLQAYAKEGEKSLVDGFPDVPIAHSFVNGFLAPIAKETGVSYDSVYYNGTSPNIQVMAQTIAAKNPAVGGINNEIDEGFCNNVITALRSAGFKGTIQASTCTQFLTAIGSSAGSVAVFSAAWLPQMASYAPASIQANLKTAGQYLAKYQPASQQNYYSYELFGAMATFAQALTAAHATITGPGVNTALLSTKNFQSFLGGQISCDHTLWPNSSACSNQIVVANSQSNGTLKPVGGSMITVETSLIPK
jgi:branched-chain amino acid transport system substrate-binding protein